jgi:hypothetical protein
VQLLVQPGQQADEPTSLGRCERGQPPVENGLDLGTALAGHDPAVRGRLVQHRPAVGRVGAADDKPRVDEAVDRAARRRVGRAYALGERAEPQRAVVDELEQEQALEPPPARTRAEKSGASWSARAAPCLADPCIE